MSQSTNDIWYEWLKRRRSAGDPQNIDAAIKSLNAMRDGVLEPIDFSGEKILLDVGCGDGLIAFGALEKNPLGRVIFCDISQDLLNDCQQTAQKLGVIDRCTFINTSAENLDILLAESVDFVTTRSVLIYVIDKSKAFAEFYRVLKKGGRLSIFEPINRFSYNPMEGIFWGYDMRPIWDIGKKIRNLYETLQPPEDDPMMNFDERDLLGIVEQAGFVEIGMKYQAQIDKRMRRTWDSFINMVGNPKIPSLNEAMKEVLTAGERQQFEKYLRPLVEGGNTSSKQASIFLWAEK